MLFNKILKLLYAKLGQSIETYPFLSDSFFFLRYAQRTRAFSRLRTTTLVNFARLHEQVEKLRLRLAEEKLWAGVPLKQSRAAKPKES